MSLEEVPVLLISLVPEYDEVIRSVVVALGWAVEATDDKKEEVITYALANDLPHSTHLKGFSFVSRDRLCFSQPTTMR